MLQIQSCLSWCIRRSWLSWRQDITPESRSLCTQIDIDTTKTRPKSEEAEIEKRAAEYLNNLDNSMKKRLAVIEMEYNIRLANKEAVPSTLSNKQKKVLLQHYPTKDKQVEYLNHLRRNELMLQKRNATRREYTEAMQFNQFQREGTYIFAETPVYNRTYYKFKLAQSFMHGAPIVFDVGYGLSRKENEKFVNMLCRAVMYARIHSKPPYLIIAGLGRNKILKELLKDRAEINKMMVDFRDESYEELFPDSKMVYLSDNGSELTEFDTDAVHVIFSGNRMPRIAQGVERRKFPLYFERFADRGQMLHQKAKILMDLSLENDVAMVMKKNFDDGLFKGRTQRQKEGEMKRREHFNKESKMKREKKNAIESSENSNEKIETRETIMLKESETSNVKIEERETNGLKNSKNSNMKIEERETVMLNGIENSNDKMDKTTEQLEERLENNAEHLDAIRGSIIDHLHDLNRERYMENSYEKIEKLTENLDEHLENHSTDYSNGKKSTENLDKNEGKITEISNREKRTKKLNEKKLKYLEKLNVKYLEKLNAKKEKREASAMKNTELIKELTRGKE